MSAVRHFFDEKYERPDIRVEEKIDASLRWQPSLHFRANDHLKVAVEVSLRVYPIILQLRHADLIAFREPVAVYCACPEEEYLKKENQEDIKLLRAHGYGLITVDEKSQVTKRHGCIPLIQFIPESDFTLEIEKLPKAWRLKLKDAYERYLVDPVSGVQHVSEVLEGLVLSAAKGATKKKWTRTLTGEPLANILDNLSDLKECKGAKAAIGGVRSYVKQYRNMSSHYPKNRRQAIEKYRAAPHAFRDGLRHVHSFRSAMSGVGVSLTL